MWANSVESHLLKRHTSEGTMKFTPQVSYVSEGKPLVISSVSDHTCWLTLEGNHLNIIYMGKAFCKTNHSIRNWMPTGEKPYECRDFEKAFSRCSYLRQHERTHKERNSVNVPYVRKLSIKDIPLESGENPVEKHYDCHQYGKVFSKSSGLSNHKRIHTGEEPHVSFMCGKAFGQSSKLTRHNITHSREKPYECGQCRNAFSQDANVIRHQRIHMGEQPYACLLHGRALSSRGGLLSRRKGGICQEPIVPLASIFSHEDHPEEWPGTWGIGQSWGTLQAWKGFTRGPWWGGWRFGICMFFSGTSRGWVWVSFWYSGRSGWSSRQLSFQVPWCRDWSLVSNSMQKDVRCCVSSH